MAMGKPQIVKEKNYYFKYVPRKFIDIFNQKIFCKIENVKIMGYFSNCSSSKNCLLDVFLLHFVIL